MKWVKSHVESTLKEPARDTFAPSIVDRQRVSTIEYRPLVWLACPKVHHPIVAMAEAAGSIVHRRVVTLGRRDLVL